MDYTHNSLNTILKSFGSNAVQTSDIMSENLMNVLKDQMSENMLIEKSALPLSISEGRVKRLVQNLDHFVLGPLRDYTTLERKEQYKRIIDYLITSNPRKYFDCFGNFKPRLKMVLRIDAFNLQQKCIKYTSSSITESSQLALAQYVARVAEHLYFTEGIYKAINSKNPTFVQYMKSMRNKIPIENYPNTSYTAHAKHILPYAWYKELGFLSGLWYEPARLKKLPGKNLTMKGKKLYAHCLDLKRLTEQLRYRLSEKGLPPNVGSQLKNFQFKWLLSEIERCMCTIEFERDLKLILIQFCHDVNRFFPPVNFVHYRITTKAILTNRMFSYALIVTISVGGFFIMKLLISKIIKIIFKRRVFYLRMVKNNLNKTSPGLRS